VTMILSFREKDASFYNHSVIHSLSSLHGYIKDLYCNNDFVCEYEFALQQKRDTYIEFDDKSVFSIQTKKPRANTELTEPIETRKEETKPPSKYFITDDPEINKENEAIYNLAQAKIEEHKTFLQREWTQWDHKKDKEYKLFYNEDKKTGLRAIKAEIVINHPIKPIFEFAFNEKNKYEYDKMYEAGQIVREVNEQTRLMYQKYKGKMGFEPRDYYVVLHSRFDASNPDNSLLLATSYFGDKYKDVPGCVRATLYIGGFTFKRLEENKTLVTFFTFSDLKISGFFMKMALPDVAKCLIHIKELMGNK